MHGDVESVRSVVITFLQIPLKLSVWFLLHGSVFTPYVSHAAAVFLLQQLQSYNLYKNLPTWI